MSDMPVEPDVETSEVTETVAPPAPKVPRKGVYVLEAGDTPGIVSTKLFGRGQFAVALVRANPEADWSPGTTITVP
jgi:hypothetical protein